MPARRLMTGLAEQTPCLHRLVKKKKEKKRKPWALLKDFTVTLPQSKTHFTSLLKGGGLGVLGTQPRPGRLG